jgi:hypothetical protein
MCPTPEPAADPAQADRQGRVGLRLYSPNTVAESFDWEPPKRLGPTGMPRSRESKLRSGPDHLRLRRPVLPTAPSPARLGLRMVGAKFAAQKTSRTSAPPPWTGSRFPELHAQFRAARFVCILYSVWTHPLEP